MKVLALSLAFFALLSTASTLAQTLDQEEVSCNKQKMNPECDEGWFTVGLGSDSNEFIHGFLRANLGRNYPFQISLASSSGIFGSRQTNFLSFSKGISLVDEIGRMSAFVGPSLVWGSEVSPEPGISVNAQLGIAPLLPMGIGLEVFSTLSPSYKMFGLGFSLVIEGHK